MLATLWSLRRGVSALQGALLAGWLTNMAALFWLDGARVLYLYCYFLPLLIGHALAALAWRACGFPELPGRIALVAVTACFLVTAPLAFHWNVPKSYCRAVLHECGH